jgi:hypothetical protein
MTTRFGGLLLMAVALAAALGSWADMARASDVRTNNWKPAPAQGPQYIAVLGEIGRPGVFEVTAPLPTLSELLLTARGTNATASGSIRIFRGGRTFQYFLSPQLKLDLVANDLVIVDSKYLIDGRRRSGMSTVAQSGPSLGGSALAPPAPEFIQLGLVNLIARPVVIDIPGTATNLANVLALLRQPVREKGEITVIRPGSGVQTVTLEEAGTIELISGSVVLFDRQSVNAAVLPALPPTVRADADTSLTPGEDLSGATPASTPLVAGAPEQAVAVAQRVEEPARPALATAPALLPTAHLTPVESAVPVDGPVPATSAPARSKAALTSAEGSKHPAPGAHLPTTAAVTRSDNARLGTILAVLAGSLLCGAAVLVLRRFSGMIPQVRKGTVQVIPEQDVAVDNLARLISGTLPIVEQPLQLSAKTEIFGRARLDSPYRIDVAQALAGPHFEVEPVRASEPESEPESTPADDSAEPGAGESAGGDAKQRRTRIDGAHPRSGAGILDRALAAFEGGLA